MTDISKLELLMKIVSLRPDGNHADLNDEYVEAYIEGQAEDILALCEPEWVPVSERLPDLYQRVLICTTDYDGDPVADLAHWNGENTGFLVSGGHRADEVTHWKTINLPEPPND